MRLPWRQEIVLKLLVIKKLLQWIVGLKIVPTGISKGDETGAVRTVEVTVEPNTGKIL